MGQRLNLEIVYQGEPLANTYYHWSAYTSKSLTLTEEVLAAYDKRIVEPTDVLKAVRLLESTGARIALDELHSVNNRYPSEKFDIARSRDEGLIAVSFDGMNANRFWEQYRISVHLDTEMVSFKVFLVENKNEYMETYEKTEDEYNRLPPFPYEIRRVSFEDFEAFANEIRRYIKKDINGFLLKDGSVLSFVE